MMAERRDLRGPGRRPSSAPAGTRALDPAGRTTATSVVATAGTSARTRRSRTADQRRFPRPRLAHGRGPAGHPPRRAPCPGSGKCTDRPSRRRTRRRRRARRGAAPPPRPVRSSGEATARGSRLISGTSDIPARASRPLRRHRRPSLRWRPGQLSFDCRGLLALDTSRPAQGRRTAMQDLSARNRPAEVDSEIHLSCAG
jgi:hypothetical protein